MELPHLTSEAWHRNPSAGLSLVLTWYNESRIFDQSMAEISRCLSEAGITAEWILVDDGSTDATQQKITDFIQTHPALAACAVFHETNQGRGAAVRDGLLLARAPVCGFIDADLEVSAEHIPEAVRTVQSGADMVIGERRYAPGLSSLFRHILTWTYRLLVQLVLRTPPYDTEAGFKFFSTAATRSVLERTRERRWFWDTEVTVLAHDAGLHIVRQPVLFTRRTDKISAVHILRDVPRAVSALSTFRKRRRAGAAYAGA